MECCICLNYLNNEDIFYLECCKNNIHHSCLIEWINSNIDNSFSDFNKCVLCKSYNVIMDDYYKNIFYFRSYNNENNETNRNITIDISNNNENERIIYLHQNIGLDIKYIIILYKYFNCKCLKYISMFTFFSVIIYFLWKFEN